MPARIFLSANPAALPSMRKVIAEVLPRPVSVPFVCRKPVFVFWPGNATGPVGGCYAESSVSVPGIGRFLAQGFNAQPVPSTGAKECTISAGS